MKWALCIDTAAVSLKPLSHPLPLVLLKNEHGDVQPSLLISEMSSEIPQAWRKSRRPALEPRFCCAHQGCALGLLVSSPQPPVSSVSKGANNSFVGALVGVQQQFIVCVLAPSQHTQLNVSARPPPRIPHSCTLCCLQDSLAT